MIFRRRHKNGADGLPDAAMEDLYDVMAFLSEQDLPATPINFELAFLRKNDPRSLAARAIDAILIGGDRITQAQANQIVSAYRQLGGGTDREKSEKEAAGHTRLRHQTLHLADLTGEAMSATGQFGRDLSEHLDEMDGGQSAQAVADSISAMIDLTGDTERRLSAAIEQIESLNTELAAAKNDAARDALTGLVNRRGLQVHLDALEPHGCTALAICDIDRFKNINDRHGHQVGDRVIQAVAESIATSCEPHIVARWGGEEFVVLMDGVALEDAASLIEAANRNLQGRSFRVRDTGEALSPVTFSAGVVMIDDGKAEDAITAADALLYQAKVEGRDRVLTVHPAALAA
ncbi:GGDEF domain-containing protein [Sphingomonas aliaeris]|uniref:diguanylate cyclase n=1 Tax=Sphingomonas aliaeris TaxID=2759526 RepID=A0A974S4S7_9SPHN|nr:GGDEF domain-containing protein [Sphingomonas aliaeris]QQV77784.1 GGDEF domain-containing protein [Sphingomonas aliaeris]